MSKKTATILRHVHFEDLGVFERPLSDADYEIRYHDVGQAGFAAIDPLQPDLLIVLGAPVGVYEDDKYPFLGDEARVLKARLGRNRPTFGICLGAQLIAAALGAKVYPSGVKEIGWGPVELSDAGLASPLRHLAQTPLLHWHGDTFDLPAEAVHLASTSLCRNQAFSVSPNVLAVQFHPEIDPLAGIEPWLVGHAVEIADAGLDPRQLREGAKTAAALPARAGKMFEEWLNGIQP